MFRTLDIYGSLFYNCTADDMILEALLDCVLQFMQYNHTFSVVSEKNLN